MRYSAVIQFDSSEPITVQRILSTESAVQFCGGRPNFDELVKEHGLRPYNKKHGSTTYDIDDLNAAIERKKAANLRK